MGDQARKGREADGSNETPPELDSPAPGPSYASMSRPNELTGSQEKVRCLFCDAEHEAWRCYRKYVCEPCANQHLVPLEKRRAMERT